MSREGMRAADADRDRVAERLRAALEAGRLDLHEYDERLQEAYAAKTYGELNRLLTDLPGEAPLVPVQSSAVVVPAQRPAAQTREWLGGMWSSWAGMAAVFTVIWALSGFGGYWPVWIIGPWGLLLALRTVKGLSSGEHRRYAVEREYVQQIKEFKRERRALEADAVARREYPASPSKEQRKAFEAKAIADGLLRPRPPRP